METKPPPIRVNPYKGIVFTNATCKFCGNKVVEQKKGGGKINFEVPKHHTHRPRTVHVCPEPEIATPKRNTKKCLNHPELFG